MQNLTPKHLRCAGQGGLCPAVYDITPPHLRCAIGTCPAVLEITPEALQCQIATSCPGVFETVAAPTQLLIIGKKPGAELMSEIEGKVGPDEHAIVIGAEYFPGLVQTRAEPVETPSGHPNAETVAAMEEARQGGLQQFATVADMMADLDGDDMDAIEAADNVALCSRIIELEAELREARDNIASWGSYVSEYFQEKHDLKGDIARIDAVLASAPRQLEEAGTADTGATRAGGQPDTNFEAKAREIIDGWWNDDCGNTLNELVPIVAVALREAYETGAVEGRDVINENLKAYISELEARLEMDHYFKLADDGVKMVRVEIPPEERSFLADGIECRDGTIALQDVRIKQLIAGIAEGLDVAPTRQEAPEGCPVLPKAASPL